MNAIADVQSSKDLRNMPINQVGIKDLRFPLQITTASGTQSTVARLTMTVRLPAEQKGTHMSRFVALMEDRRRELDYGELKDLTQRMLELLDSDAGKISIAFPFFRQKTAPVSGIRSLLRIPPQPHSAGTRYLALPVLEGNFAIRRAQPAFARYRIAGVPRKRIGGRSYRHCRKPSLLPTLRPFETSRRKIRNRTRL